MVFAQQGDEVLNVLGARRDEDAKWMWTFGRCREKMKEEENSGVTDAEGTCAYSRKVPGSRRTSIRSRAVSFPCRTPER